MTRSLRPEKSSDVEAIASLTVAALLNAPRRAGAMSVLLVAEQGGWLAPISVLPFDEGLPQGTVGFHEAFGATS